MDWCPWLSFKLKGQFLGANSVVSLHDLKQIDPFFIYFLMLMLRSVSSVPYTTTLILLQLWKHAYKNNATYTPTHGKF